MKRTIAAILAADVAGFSRLVAEDEDDTLRRLGEYSRLYREEVARVGGRVFNTAGDAILAEFPSAVEALRAAIAIQERLCALNADYPAGRRILFRMGLTIGDVVETDGGDLLGDGVNVAARLEGIAEPGGICLSRSVHEAIAARVDVAFRDIGPQTLKNIPRPIHAFRVVLPSQGQAGADGGRRRAWPRLAAAAAVLLLVLGGGAGLVLRYDLFGKPAADASADGGPALAARETADRTDLLTVAVARPRRTCFKDEIRLSGVLVPRSEAEVGPDAEGLRVQRVLAKPMDRVTAGQALAELSGPDQTGVTLRAPVAGTVAQSTAFVGAPASLQAPPLFRIVAQGEFDLAAEVPIAALSRLAHGQGVTVTPLGQADVQGRVRSVSTEVDGATQLGRARVQLRGGPDLRQGLFASGIVTVDERCGLGVRASSVLRGPEGSVVYVANDGRIEGRLVTTGLTAGDDVEIRNGIAADDSVVLRAGSFVREGDVVRPMAVSDSR